MTKNEYYDYVLETYRPAETLIRMVPPDKLDWRPGPTFMSLGQLIQHLGDGVGLPLRCVITGDWPFKGDEEMMEQMKLENLPSCGVEEGLKKLEEDKSVLREALAGVSEADFSQKVVSTPWGTKGKIERMAIDFREHFTNHKMQLFMYLKVLGLPVNTETLYFG